MHAAVIPLEWLNQQLELFPMINEHDIADFPMNEGLSPDDIQVSGDHYKTKAIQPWNYIAANNLDYFQGNVIKYVTRWRDKAGIADLEKAMHYLQKYIEVCTQNEKDK